MAHGQGDYSNQINRSSLAIATFHRSGASAINVRETGCASSMWPIPRPSPFPTVLKPTLVSLNVEGEYERESHMARIDVV